MPRKENYASLSNKAYWKTFLFSCFIVLVKYFSQLIDLMLYFSISCLSLWTIFCICITYITFYAISLSFIVYLSYFALHYFYPFIPAIFLMGKAYNGLSLSAWFFYLIAIRLVYRFKHPPRKLRVLSPST